MANKKSRTIIEICPHCDYENQFEWDVTTMGFKTVCRNCGKQLLLCDECCHAEDGLNKNACRCDWREDANGNSICFRCKKEEPLASKVYYAEWFSYIKAYRIFDPKKPQETIEYAGDLEKAKERYPEHKIIEIDKDSMHVECQ